MLAGDVPEQVAANVRDFLTAMRARDRWSFSLGAALAPDSNIGAASEERTIYINVFGQPLPFERNADELTTSGIGVSVWGGAEYQVPLAERWRLRAGGEAARREYSGSEFDQLYPRHPSRPALAGGPRHGGEPAGERAAALGRHRAGQPRVRCPARGGAPAEPASHGLGAGILA